uniref:Zinc finger, CCHC-type n=1 Tax=Tanacetum cinerariifolium TaxID=118510 RepID=A0A6L2JEN0_TANCI|nr:zinc finger, CCHC-type [Tanacetum cinerariifolium]
MAITFADTHNMIAYLTKSDASEGFDQIIDFLNGSSIKEGKGFSGVETPLFKGMIVAQQADDVADEGDVGVDVDVVPAADAEPSLPSPTPTTQHHHHHKNYLPPHKKAKALKQDNVAQALEIIKLKQMVKKLERKNKLKVFGLRRLRKRKISANIDTDEDVTLKDVNAVEKAAEIEENVDVQGRREESQAQIYKIDLKHADKVLGMQDDDAARRGKGVVIRDPEETATPSIIIHTEPKSKDKRKEIMVEEPKPLKKQAQIEQDEAYARELEAELNKNINWDDMIEKVQRKEKEDNVVLRALKRKTESSEEKAVKKQNLDEEVEELKKHLQIVPNNDDDFYTEATPLALKVPVVDYEIYSKKNKPYFKIIRADGTHQLFLSFLSLLRNFDREDLEPDVEAQVWKSQRGIFGLAKVKSWRLLESCRVYVITLITTQMILLVKRRYPLIRFTLDQMLNNVRLEVEEEEVSLELLRFHSIRKCSKLTYHTGIILAQNKYVKVIGSLILRIHERVDIHSWWGAVSWGSKKQICLTDSTMAAEFVALMSCYKEAEWLRDLLINIPLWPKPMPPISVHCDIQSTLSRAYNQVYNGKSRHIELRHRQVNQLINDGVITVSFLRSNKNLADPFTKGLARKLIEISGEAKVHHPNMTRSSANLIIILGYGNIFDNVHLSECGSEAASYELKGLALKHSEKPRYTSKASFNGSAQSGLNEREEGYT